MRADYHLERCHIIPQWEIARQTIPAEWLAEDVILVSPDAGAHKKITKLCPHHSRICIGVKQRDAAGKITQTDLFSPKPLEGKRCLIVDDICDGGRTFIELARLLRAKGASSVALYVTHGIFSQGLAPLQEHLNVIFTTDSFPNTGVPHEKWTLG